MTEISGMWRHEAGRSAVSVGSSHNEQASGQRNTAGHTTESTKRHRTKSVALAEQM